ncbi:MAG: group 1 glycosyl transferase [Flavobacteriaceae bacterium]|nr:group 1 glycosyl transferase [Flavobacteriaceae bacterium]|tara:strand:- start:245098 stop:246564 length:1467 start_codon:yes stop_codon:yes gene_type:complete
MQKIEIKEGPRFEHYRAYGSLTSTVDSFLKKVQGPVSKLKDHTIWMINSTAIGGGVAEMLPSQMRILRELGMSIEWLVIEASNPDFFTLTKRIHNAIHGSGDGAFNEADKEVYEAVNRENLDAALSLIQHGDLVVVHDPQPLPLGRMIKEHLDVSLIWRCHIGLEEQNEVSNAVWDFLSPYFEPYNEFVFSLESYTPKQLEGRTTIITPSIDPLSHKNRTLSLDKCLGVLHQSGIINTKPPLLYPFYEHRVRRVMPDGSFGPVNAKSPLDIIWYPTVFQVSRWDRLKGFKELMDAFILLKKRSKDPNGKSAFNTKRIKTTRLVLAGPDPKFVADDPEGNQVLQELINTYSELPKEFQDDIALLLLPMDNQKENALIVNALQLASNIVVQNSLQEGFGLTATEAMWKRKCVLVSGAAGLNHQVQHGVNGIMNKNPKDIEALTSTLEFMLNNPHDREAWGFNAQVRVIENFTLFSPLYDFIELWVKIKQD